jgi:hypothetical protein
MKLALAKDRGVDFLTASGAIEARDAAVIKAGVGKLIRDGKNQIAIEISEGRIPPELIRELIALDLLARELSGRVVVVASDKSLRTEIENFARPVTLDSFATRADALNFFEKSNVAPLPPITLPGDSATAAAPPQAASVAPVAGAESEKPAEAEVKLLKEQIRERELKEVGELRKTIARLEGENKVLLGQLQTLVVERRMPPDEAAYRERVRDLEDKLEKLMEEVGKEKGK